MISACIVSSNACNYPFAIFFRIELPLCLHSLVSIAHFHEGVDGLVIIPHWNVMC